MVGRIEMPGARAAGVPGASSDSGAVRVLYWAAARDIAGVEAESFPAGSLPMVLAAALTAHPRLVPVLRVCSVFVNGEQVPGAGPRAVVAHAGDTAPGDTSSCDTAPADAGPPDGPAEAGTAGAAPGDAGPEVAAGSTVEILPPFAGG